VGSLPQDPNHPRRTGLGVLIVHIGLCIDRAPTSAMPPSPTIA
jgi:hypothetical protein